MADNTRGGSESGTAPLIATEEVTYSGDTADVQLMKPVLTTGAEGSKTVVELGGDATNGLDVDVTRLPALVAGSANIGDVDVLTLPGIAGDTAHDDVDAGNPVKIGGKASSNVPTAVATGDRVDAWLGITGALVVTTYTNVADAGADGANVSRRAIPAGGTIATPDPQAMYLFNGTNWDRARSGGVLGMQGIAGAAAPDDAIAANPVTIGGRASAVAPTDVSANGDVVNAWNLRNGARATVLTAAGALIGGDATNGLDVDVTRLPALVAGTANIGDVDVLTVPAPLSTTGGGTEATALRVTLANDSTGLVSVDDNGGTLTVDGTVEVTGVATAANQTTELASLAAIESDVDALRVSSQLIDDTINTLGTATYTEASTRGALIAAVRRDADTSPVNTDNEIAPLTLDANGRLKVEAFSGETLPVSLSALPALVAGSANIGDVDVLTLPSIPAGTNNIGDVDVLTLPSLPAGTNNIGDVDVLTLPAPHKAYTPTSISARYTTAQTSTIIGPTNGAGVTMVVTHFQIDVGGTVGGDVTLYFGTGAFSRGTSQAVFDGGFLPSAAQRVGALSPGLWAGVAGDELRITSTNSQNPLTVTINYYTF